MGLGLGGETGNLWSSVKKKEKGKAIPVLAGFWGVCMSFFCLAFFDLGFLFYDEGVCLFGRGVLFLSGFAWQEKDPGDACICCY